MANELSRIDTWLVQTLGLDATISGYCGANQVFVHTLPQKAAYPLVLCTYLSSIDVQPINVKRAMTRALYQIVVMTKGAPDSGTRTVADQIDTLIGFARSNVLNISGTNWVFNGRREMPVSIAEYATEAGGSGVRFHRMGGDYRIEAYT